MRLSLHFLVNNSSAPMPDPQKYSLSYPKKQHKSSSAQKVLQASSLNCPSGLTWPQGMLISSLMLVFTYNHNLTSRLSKQMGNSEFIIPQNLRSQWIQITKPGERIVHNFITQQNFILHRLSKKPCLSTKQYIERSIYPIPHSPKLIILDDSPSQLCYLVQSGSSSFKYLIRRKQLIVEVLGVIKDLAVVADQLRQKYGNFELKEEMVGVLKNQELMVWIHENRSMNARQLPLGSEEKSEEKMIRMIVGMVQDNTKLDLTFLMKQYAGALNFKQFIKHLAIKIQVEKFKIAQKEGTTPEMQRQQQLVYKGGDAEGISKGLGRTNSTFKDFEEANPKSHLRHRRNYTNFEPLVRNERSHSKKSQQPTQPSVPTKRITKEPSIFNKIRKPIEKVHSSINISISHSHSSPRFKQFKGTIETTEFLQISFSKKSRPNIDYNPTRVNICSKGQAKNLATRSSQETIEGDHEFKEKQMDTKDEATARKGMEEDYLGLFDDKSQETQLYNFQEEFSIYLNDD